jgi:hypothetical protein
LDISIFSMSIFWVHNILHCVLINLGKEFMELTHLQRLLFLSQRRSHLPLQDHFVSGGQVADIDCVSVRLSPFPFDYFGQLVCQTLWRVFVRFINN